MITTRGLARRFVTGKRTVEAVRGVDLDVEPGTIVAVLGPNGAGKTTTLRMLATLLRPTGGTATIGGYDLLTQQVAVRRCIGYVAQSSGTVGERRVSEEIELQARLHGLSKVEARRRVPEVAARLDLAGLERRLCGTLSGGQRRRVDLALGLVHAPGLVFLDEPTAGLDPQSRAHLWEYIRSIRAEEGVAVLLTTHYLEEADSLADRVVVIDHGLVVAEGSPQQLKTAVSHDLVSVSVAPGQVPAATRIASRLPGLLGLDLLESGVRLEVHDGDLAVPVALRALSVAGVDVTGVHVHHPSLDDVFLNLTGRSLREDDDRPVPPAAAAPSTGRHRQTPEKEAAGAA